MKYLVLVLFLAGCGSSNGQQTQMPNVVDPLYQCPAVFSACGGSLVGTWQWAQTCSRHNPSCVEIAVVEMNNVTTSFSEDGTFTLSTGSTLVHDSIPASCYTAGSALAGASCSDPSASSCGRDTEENCVCSGTHDMTSEAGTYVTTASTYTLTYNGGGASRTFEYCIQGSQLLSHRVDAPSINIQIDTAL